MFTRRAFGAGAMASPLLLAAAARAGPDGVEPYPLDTFYGSVDTYDAALSPNGRRVAVLRNRKEKPATSGKAVVKDSKKAGQDALTDAPGKPASAAMADTAWVDILDAANPDEPAASFRVGPYIVDGIEWGNDDRLLILVRMPTANPYAVLMGKKAGQFTFYMRRILSVNADGRGAAVLFNDRAMLSHVYDLATVVDFLPDQPDHVLMSAWHMNAKVMALFRVNIHTGAFTQVELGRANTFRWVTDNGVPVLRWDINSKATVQRVYARAPNASDWKFVRRTRTDQEPDFSYLGRGPRPGVILAAARVEGEDVTSVRELDLASLAFGPPLHRRDGRDVIGGLTDERGRYLATKYLGDQVSYDFIDPALGEHVRGLNASLGGEHNVSILDVDHDLSHLVAGASGTRDPGRFVLYDKASRKVSTLGRVRPDLDPARLGRGEALKVRTRDGYQIGAYLTAPPDGRSGPLLVWPHGGPELRDYLNYDRTVQIFAAQGWWVLQPNFRGSGGLGQAFADAGRRRWGDRMQEDVEDAVDHVIRLGKVDSRRIAIGGASYGGYAALMGVTRRKDLYRAAISICGPADLPAMLKWVKKEDDDSFDYWSRTIGHPASDKAMLEAASPARRAPEIGVPILLIHGAEDPVVPVDQSRLMAKALKAAGKPHEYIEVPKFGHADWDDDKDKELMTRMIGFLKQAFA